MYGSPNGSLLPMRGAVTETAEENTPARVFNMADTAPLDAVDRPVPQQRVAPAPAPVTGHDGDTAEVDSADGVAVDEEVEDEASLAERATQEVRPDSTQARGERIFPWVYGLSISIGITGQVAGFGALFGGALLHYLAAAVVGTGFELIMISFGDRSLGMRKREHKVRQWLPFMVISGIAAGVASAMNALHWWTFDPGHTLALIFAGVAVLGYLGHMFAGFVEGTKNLADLGERRRIRARELAAEQRQAADERRQAAAKQQQLQRTEELRKRAEQARKNLPRPSRKGEKIKKEQATVIGVALGVTDKDQLITEVERLNWSAPTSKNTLKTWMDEITESVNASR